MKALRLLLIAMLLISISCDDDEDTPFPPPVDTQATYTAVFDAQWTPTSHPYMYPGNAHFSWMVGTTHQQQDVMFRLGGMATEGIEDMAETGATSMLASELDTAILMNNAYEYKIGNVIDGDGRDEITVTATTDHHLFSFVSMIAPSPDWFVANVNVDLMNNGDWIDSLELDVILYDSGTDSGPTFTSSNDDTVPKAPIALIVGPPLGDGSGVNPAVGKLILTRQ
ncbi:hypothetical protein KH5_14680 [Urechidicola sp. KH5]